MPNQTSMAPSSQADTSNPPQSRWRNRDLGLFPVPAHLRYDPQHPPHFGLLLNVSFGFASTFTVANLYYCQPLLIEYSNSFGVSYEEVSRIPTLIQAGYATGIVLISPLGDLIRRRQLILLIVSLSALLTIGLAITNNLIVFEVLTFLIGMLTVTPQILLPLAADLAPPERRAAALSVVLSGLLFGVLMARLLAGVIAEFVSWRVVYYFAIGVQSMVLCGIYILIPDYPAKNPELSYFDILWTMATFAVTEPALIQACLINFASAAQFANFWVTLTFLLGGPPYNFSTLVIGLFALVGMFGVAVGPFVGKGIDKLVPWYATLIGIIGGILFQSVQVGAGGIHIAAIIIATFGLDVFRQTVQTSLSTSIFSIDPAARARLNAVFLLSLFLGQVMGTSVGTRIFVKDGWRWAAALNLFLGLSQILLLFLRGPHTPRPVWFGFAGGFRALPSREESIEGNNQTDAEKSQIQESPSQDTSGNLKEGTGRHDSA